MHFIDVSELIVPTDRQRKDFPEDKLEELAGSIQQLGLLHPPAVRQDGVTLLAGHRRCKAMAYLHHYKIPFKFNGVQVEPGQIPVVSTHEMDELELKEAELAENLVREDLSWQEESLAIAELTEIRRARDPNWTPKDTAREIDDTDEEPSGPTYQKARDAELLREHLDDPDVLKAKDSKEAVKIVRKKKMAQLNEKLAAAHQARGHEHQIILGDMRQHIQGLPDNHFSVLLTDPPYGVNAHEFGEMADAEHAYDDTPENALELAAVLATEGYRVCTTAAHAYVFCDIRMWESFRAAFRAAGWEVWPVPLIWNKGNGMLPRPQHGPRRTYEAILFANKGDRKVNKVQPDVISVSELPRPDFGAQKPHELYRNLLARSVVPGDHVLDPFAGAGPIIPAANDCDVSATAIELNEEKYNYICARLDERTPEPEPVEMPSVTDILSEAGLAK